MASPILHHLLQYRIFAASAAAQLDFEVYASKLVLTVASPGTRAEATPPTPPQMTFN